MPRRTQLPICHQLEPRLLFTSELQGTSGPDHIVVSYSAPSLIIEMNGNTFTYPASAFTDLLISGNDGNDFIEFDGLPTTHVTIQGGNGDDQILVGGNSQTLDNVGAVNDIGGGDGTDTVAFYDNNSTTGHTYTVSQSQVTRDGGANAVGYRADVENLTLYTSRGNDAVNISSTFSGVVTTISNAGGNDTFNVGGANGLQSISGYLQLQSLGGSTQMNLNDAGDSTGRNIIVINADVDHGLIGGWAPANIKYQYSRTSNVTLTAGSGIDTLEVDATGTSTTISNDQSDDRVLVGDGIQGVQNIKGALLVTNPVDDTTLTISDAADTTGRQFVLDNDGATATLSGISPAPIKWSLIDVLNVNITSGTALDVFVLRRNMWNLNYDGNNNTDNIFVGYGSGVGLQGISGTVSLNNTNSYNFLQFNDNEDTTARNISFTNVNVSGIDYQQSTGLIPGTVRYKTADTAGVSYITGKGVDTINVPATNLPLRFGSAGGSDSLIVGNGTLQGITATVGVIPNAAKINVTLDDSADTTGRTINHDLVPSGSATLGQITGLSPAPIQYDVTAVTSVSLRPGSGTDTINVSETSAAVPVTIAYSAGLDIVNVNTDSAGSAGALFNETERFGALNIGAGGKAIMLPSENVLFTKALLLASGAMLDLTNTDMVLDYAGTSPITSVQNLIRSASNGGLWNGTTGITSASAASVNPKNKGLGAMEASDYKSIYGANAAFHGLAIDTTAVLVKYTYYGDANFSGDVNFDDYVKVDVGFNGHRTGWVNGDFNYSGAVDFDDYVLIDTAFNTQSSPLGRRGAEAGRSR